MNTYITGTTIKKLREAKDMTQQQLAQEIGVTAKAVSKWETAKGLPDISLIEPLSRALGVSVMELMSGETVINKNASSNILFSKFYVCPVCGNIIHSSGAAVISCCGITLPPLESEETDSDHTVIMESVEDEKFITVRHEMSKKHFISFIAYVTTDRVQFVKFYPEGNAETRLQFRGRGYLYIYCNRHGLMKMKV
ncbi:MAG: helix-turn-helix domain-containing protein [Acutalibacteraceae bacterium]|nr:helix-turn-helix domain-containing protein [Acutalibacteraceae bacterium]